MPQDAPMHAQRSWLTSASSEGTGMPSMNLEGRDWYLPERLAEAFSQGGSITSRSNLAGTSAQRGTFQNELPAAGGGSPALEGAGGQCRLEI